MHNLSDPFQQIVNRHTNKCGVSGSQKLEEICSRNIMKDMYVLQFFLCTENVVKLCDRCKARE